jgi:hypothetical protein
MKWMRFYIARKSEEENNNELINLMNNIEDFVSDNNLRIL